MRQSYSIFLLVCFIWLALTNVLANPTPEKPKLKGVTIRSPPFVNVVDDHYEGFAVDMMDLIAKKLDIEYTLYTTPDGKYGNGLPDGTVTGMIGEVHKNNADFALADLTMTEARSQYIQFTEPFMVNQLAALVRKQDSIAGMKTLEDLVNSDAPIVLGTLRLGATNHLLSKSEDAMAKKMYESMHKNPEQSFVSSLSEGVEKVSKPDSNYALIVESAFGEHQVANDCQLTLLKDNHSLYPRKYAIALRKDSPYLEKFNEAIKELIENGEIERLRSKYWSNDCENQATTTSTTNVTP